jgi:hypothetical protein
MCSKDSAGQTYLPQIVSSFHENGVTVEFVSDWSFGARGFRCIYTSALDEIWLLNFEASTLNHNLLSANVAVDVCRGKPCGGVGAQYVGVIAEGEGCAGVACGEARSGDLGAQVSRLPLLTAAHAGPSPLCLFKAPLLPVPL